MGVNSIYLSYPARPLPAGLQIALMAADTVIGKGIVSSISHAIVSTDSIYSSIGNYVPAPQPPPANLTLQV